MLTVCHSCKKVFNSTTIGSIQKNCSKACSKRMKRKRSNSRNKLKNTSSKLTIPNKTDILKGTNSNDCPNPTKITYGEIGSAIAAIERQGRTDLYPYYCSCGGIHLSHNNKNNSMKLSSGYYFTNEYREESLKNLKNFTVKTHSGKTNSRETYSHVSSASGDNFSNSIGDVIPHDLQELLQNFN